jgi:hypothetical protein
MNNQPCSCQSNGGPFEIFVGQDKTMPMRVAYQQTGLPLDLTECTQISVALPNNTGTFTNLTLTGDQVTITSPASYGQFSVNITNEISSTLNVGIDQNVDVSFTISGLITIVRFWRALNVLEAN